MVEHPISTEYEENSSDIELALDITEQVDQGEIIETIIDEFEMESAQCEIVNETCSTVHSFGKISRAIEDDDENCEISNHIDEPPSRTNGISPRETSENEDVHQNNSHNKFNLSSAGDGNKSKSVKINGFVSDTPNSPSEIINSQSNDFDSAVDKISLSDSCATSTHNCDKSINLLAKEDRINGDIPKLVNNDGCSSAVQKRRLDNESKEADSESGGSVVRSVAEKRPKVDDANVPRNRNGIGEISIEVAKATPSPEGRKKTTARKSITASALRTAMHIVDEECGQKSLASESIADAVARIHNGVDDARIDFSNIDASSLPAHPDDKLALLEEQTDNIVFSFESLSDEKMSRISKKLRTHLSRRQLEEIVIEKCCELITESAKLGEVKKQTIEYQQTEVYRKQAVCNIEKQLYQLKGVSNVFMDKVRSLSENHQITSPTIVTRSVGLQCALERNMYSNTKYGSSSPSVRTMSTNDDDQTQTTSTSRSSHRASQDLGPPSSSSSPASTSVASSSDTNRRKQSLPADNTANSSARDAVATHKNVTSAERNATPTPVIDEIVDLTETEDKSDGPQTPAIPAEISRCKPKPQSELSIVSRHPAPLPPTPKFRSLPNWKLPPPRPDLSIQISSLGIQMTWDLALNPEQHAPIAKYQIFAYQETTVPATVDQWKCVGDVDSLDLPMQCTLTQFLSGYKYHFTVRAVDKHTRIGPFSLARSVSL